VVTTAEERIAFGAVIVARRAALSVEWETHRREADVNGDLALQLCLIHPEWYSPLMSMGRPDPRGPRGFATAPPVGQRCQSSYIWGYECKIASSRPVADHLYPFEAGGPSDARNLVWLCEWHNRVKSNDIHLLPWEEMDLTWVAEVLDRIAVRRDMLRRLERG
jgi:hypothetical protein